MPLVEFTPNLARQTLVESRRVEGVTLREAMEAVFSEFPAARGYILDDQGQVRQHVDTLLTERQSLIARDFSI
jgi:molybdopterin synthase sulfur carrier subunit